MKKNFFCIEEDFEDIISKNLEGENIKLIKQVPTGWTNLVFDVETENTSYIFRFPRSNFWSKMLVKEYGVCQSTRDKISFTIPDMKLIYHLDRPFSLHTKMVGTTLIEVVHDLSIKELENIADDINKFILEFNNLSRKDLEPSCDIALSDFLLELANLHFLDKEKYNHQLFRKNNTGLIHGDLNPGNIIVHKGKLVGFLDFCFSGYGNPFADLARIIGRLPKATHHIFISSHEKYLKETVDLKLLEDYVLAWKDIDSSYTEFIRKNNPDIDLSLIIN